MFSAADFIKRIGDYVLQRMYAGNDPWTKIAKIDPAYTTGKPKLQWEGELEDDDVTPVMTAKQFPYMAHYTPVAGDRVVVKKINGGWVVIGKIVP